MNDVETATGAEPRDLSGLEIIAAPTNLGLRPGPSGREPGAWRAPGVYLAAGLAGRLAAARVIDVPRPRYDYHAQPATRTLNGVTIRGHALVLADAVEGSLAGGRFPLVLGGDCSILLGCMLGARRRGRCGLVHVDGHLDFNHPGNSDAGSRLQTAAGMDLALATGRGELLLTHWPGVGMPLVPDRDVVQVGARDGDEVSLRSTNAVEDPSFHRISIEEVVRLGVKEVTERVATLLADGELRRVWVHVDLDVLDQAVLPAVDSPGRPGLDFSQLTDLVGRLLASSRFIGADVTIYDPELDPDGEFVGAIVDFLTTCFRRS